MLKNIETLYCSKCQRVIGNIQGHSEKIVCPFCDHLIFEPQQKIIKTEMNTAFCLDCEASFGVTSTKKIEELKCPQCSI